MTKSTATSPTSSEANVPTTIVGWYYISRTGEISQPRGPIPESVMQRLVAKGLVCPLSTLAYPASNTGLPQQWAPISQFSPFKDLCEAMNTPWVYLDATGVQKGPLHVGALSKAFREGDIDGLTKVWTQGMADWQSLSEVVGLRQVVQMEAAEGEGLDYSTAAMVFSVDEQPILDEAAKTALSRSKSKPKEGAKRSFTADDGTNYRWSNDINDWIPGGDGDAEEEEEEDRATPKNAREPMRQGVGEAYRDSKIAPPVGQQKRKNAWSSKNAGKWVYVQGLPVDTKEEEVAAHFAKVGVLALDPLTQRPRIKMYRDEGGNLKGDASICYAMEGSVALALQVLDGSQLRVGVYLQVSRAKFEVKGGSFDASKRLRVGQARVKTAHRAVRQALSWNDEDDSGVGFKGLKIVIIENMFDPVDFEEHDKFGLDLERDLVEECNSLGPVEKITVFSRNRLGPVAVKFSTAFAASECIKLMDGRWFGKRQLRCHYWDGATNYTVEESEVEQQKRLDDFGDWLEQQDLPPALQLQKE